MEEIWKDIKGYEGLYQISNLGNVKSFNYRKMKTTKNKQINLDKNGYSYVILYGKDKPKLKRIHRLVAEAFIPNPHNLPQVNHKNEIKSDNTIENLEWCNSKYNNTYGDRINKTKNKLYIKVKQYDKNNSLIKVWQGIRIASISLGINNGHISDCCKHKRKSAGGYIWEYYK